LNIPKALQDSSILDVQAGFKQDTSRVDASYQAASNAKPYSKHSPVKRLRGSCLSAVPQGIHSRITGAAHHLAKSELKEIGLSQSKEPKPCRLVRLENNRFCSAFCGWGQSEQASQKKTLQN
jgi:hypothetical protein